jgi:hypothetical protein
MKAYQFGEEKSIRMIDYDFECGTGYHHSKIMTTGSNLLSASNLLPCIEAAPAVLDSALPEKPYFIFITFSH